MVTKGHPFEREPFWSMWDELPVDRTHVAQPAAPAMFALMAAGLMSIRPMPLRLGVVGFLLLRADHPRSIRFAIASASRAVARIHGERGPGLGHLDEAERLLGRMATRLEYADLSEVAHDGGRETLTDVRRCVAQANAALQQRYFAG